MKIHKPIVPSPVPPKAARLPDGMEFLALQESVLTARQRNAKKLKRSYNLENSESDEDVDKDKSNSQTPKGSVDVIA